MSVFVLDRRKRPLMPCTETRARLLLQRGRAVMARRYPFTIRATGSFNVQTSAGVVQGISHRNCRVLQRGDGCGYHQRTGLLPALKDGVSARDKAR